MPIRFSNNPSATLATGINTSATSLVLTTGQGARFPTLAGGETFPVTLDDGTGMEIVLCTARSGDTLTVTRAQEGTTALSFAAGSLVQARITKAVLEAFVQKDGGTLTGPILAVAANTPGTPAIAFAGDADTGMYRISADNIGFSTNGNLTFQVHSTGVTVSGVASTSGGVDYSRTLNFPNSWENCWIDAEHKSGDYAGLRFIVGTSSPKTMSFRNSGHLSVPGSLTLGGTNPTVTLGSSQVYQGSGHFFLQARSDYRIYWDNSDGAWRWQRGAGFGTTDMSLVPGGTLNLAGEVITSASVKSGLFQSPSNGPAVMRCNNGSNTFILEWSGGTGTPYWLIDGGGAQGHFCTASNTKNLSYVGGGGGPHGINLNGYDFGGNLYGIFVDAVSDARIKENIRDTEVDAVGLVMSVPLRAYDIKAEVAAWQRSVGATPEQREKNLREATPVAVPLGFVTQELQRAVPEAVRVPYAGYQPPAGSPLPADCQTYSPEALVPYLWRAIQQQQEQINALTARVAALEPRP